MYTVEPLIPDPSPFEVQSAIEKLERHKSPGIDQTLIRGPSRRSRNLLILFGTRKNCHSSEMNLLLCIFLQRVIKLVVLIVKECHCYQLHTEFYPIFVCQG
jgi:hypothetical protein